MVIKFPFLSFLFLCFAALFQYVSTESREFEDMMTILTSTYIDTGSAGCFTYSKPRLVHSEPLEKEVSGGCLERDLYPN